ncbi:hypothetical protein ES319_A09G048500v1 [Gossypium barbadense]|uniref:Uncharacterized protein n=3 Tax=Gossypium TaxID=3633 RepID=A0A5J5UBA1_GOSBA|nr:hypothetical protein ES319_A09G048500v1 [Gossypium barbadense]TYH01431.1 hypothetical protein ES288_A09G057500v1 [Gossypium darwinii]TYI09205.1 hypothetical protein ES332_A09G054700v1 [Gossypium tomentosum]
MTPVLRGNMYVFKLVRRICGGSGRLCRERCAPVYESPLQGGLPNSAIWHDPVEVREIITPST